MLRRRLWKSVRLLMVGARRELLRATASGAQAQEGRKHCGPSKKLQTRKLPTHSQHLRILLDPRPDATIAPSIQTNAPRRTNGYSDQPLVTTGAATGYLPTGLLPRGYLPTGYLPTGAGATG